jgi:hypothetical protein
MNKALHIASLLAFGIVASAAAQHPVHAQAPHVKPNAPAARPAAKPETRGTESAEQTKSFTGISKKLGMTPQALETAYQTALMQNPKLTRGQFIAANVLGHNLSAKGVTTDAILLGLQHDKSIGQTLHGLGLSDKEADEAERAANKEAKEAERDADKAAKAAEKKQDQQAKP